MGDDSVDETMSATTESAYRGIIEPIREELPIVTSSCGGAHPPRYSSIARLILGSVMVLTPGVLGLAAGMHAGWDNPWVWGPAWAVMLVAILWAPIALRPPQDPVAKTLDMLVDKAIDANEAMRIIGVIHDRRQR